MTKERIKELKVQGITEGYDELWIVCDTFNYEDYPVFVKNSEKEKKEKIYSTNMQQIMEQIKLN